MSESKQLELGPRIKFKTTWLGDVETIFTEGSSKFAALCAEMADALWEMEQMGVTPVISDGKVAGNGAVKVEVEGRSFLLVSKSGKHPGRMDVAKDLCLVSSFNRSEWSAEYYSFSKDTAPTSDTPLHWFILQETDKYNWSMKPKWCLHGHAFETEEEAKLYNIPISTEETLFSTPEDTEAIMTLLEKYPYPENSMFVRKGHGFLALGQTCEEAMSHLKKLKFGTKRL